MYHQFPHCKDFYAGLSAVASRAAEGRGEEGIDVDLWAKKRTVAISLIALAVSVLSLAVSAVSLL